MADVAARFSGLANSVFVFPVAEPAGGVAAGQ